MEDLDAAGGAEAMAAANVTMVDLRIENDVEQPLSGSDPQRPIAVPEPDTV